MHGKSDSSSLQQQAAAAAQSFCLSVDKTAEMRFFPS